MSSPPRQIAHRRRRRRRRRRSVVLRESMCSYVSRGGGGKEEGDEYDLACINRCSNTKMRDSTKQTNKCQNIHLYRFLKVVNLCCIYVSVFHQIWQTLLNFAPFLFCTHKCEEGREGRRESFVCDVTPPRAFLSSCVEHTGCKKPTMFTTYTKSKEYLLFNQYVHSCLHPQRSHRAKETIEVPSYFASDTIKVWPWSKPFVCGERRQRKAFFAFLLPFFPFVSPGPSSFSAKPDTSHGRLVEVGKNT